MDTKQFTFTLRCIPLSELTPTPPNSLNDASIAFLVISLLDRVALANLPSRVSTLRSHSRCKIVLVGTDLTAAMALKSRTPVLWKDLEKVIDLCEGKHGGFSMLRALDLTDPTAFEEFLQDSVRLLEHHK